MRLIPVRITAKAKANARLVSFDFLFILKLYI